MKRYLLAPFKNERGLALILSVLILTVLTVAAASTITTSRHRTQATYNTKTLKEVFYACDACLAKAERLLFALWTEQGRSIDGKLQAGYDDDLLESTSVANTANKGATGFDYMNGVYFERDDLLEHTGDPGILCDMIMWNNPTDPSGDPQVDTDNLVYIAVFAKDWEAHEGTDSIIYVAMESRVPLMTEDIAGNVWQRSQEGATAYKALSGEGGEAKVQSIEQGYW